MGAGTAYLSSNTFLNEYGFGPMKERKKAAVVVGGYLDDSSQWPTFIKSVNESYDTLAKVFMAKSKKSRVTQAIAKKARKGVAAVLAEQGTGPGLFVEMFVPGYHGSHFFGMRSDGIIANGYPNSVFNPASSNSGVGLGLGLQEDYSHGFCQTFAIMWLLISQKTKRSVDACPKWVTKTQWGRLCAEWHDNIWKRLKNSEGDAKVIDVKEKLLVAPSRDLKQTLNRLRYEIYLHNAELALLFLVEFTKYCDYYYTIEEVVEMCGSISVRGCPTFSEEAMKKFLGVITRTVELDSGTKDMVTLHGIFSYLKSQGRPLFEKWFKD